MKWFKKLMYFITSYKINIFILNKYIFCYFIFKFIYICSHFQQKDRIPIIRINTENILIIQS